MTQDLKVRGARVLELLPVASECVTFQLQQLEIFHAELLRYKGSIELMMETMDNVVEDVTSAQELEESLSHMEKRLLELIVALQP